MGVNEGTLLDNEMRCESCQEAFAEQDLRSYSDAFLCADCANEIDVMVCLFKSGRSRSNKELK